MGILETTVGHGRQQKALTQAWLEGCLPSQFLFVGPEGIGKKRFAWGLAELLLCERPPEPGKTCGLCSSCIKIRSGFHESVLFLEPDKNLIKLERAKDIQDFLSLAYDGKARVIIVDDAHALNAQASNSLLKVFEEPPAHVYFFLITHRWTQVLPTIRSRATRVAFSPLNEADLARWADGDQSLIRLARGSVKELLHLKDPQSKEWCQEAQLLLQRLLTEENFLVLGDWRDAIKDRDKLLSLSRYWLILLRDYFTERLTVDSGDGREAMVSPLKGLSSFTDSDLWEFWDRSLQLESGLLGHRDPVLLLEEWLLPLLRK